MQRRLFALWGLAGTGKTTTLKLIAREILHQFPAASANISLDPIPNGDIDKIIIVIGSIKIGITTKGDPNSDLDKRLQFLIDEDCIIVLCATRTSGATVGIVEAFERANNFRATWVTNYQSGFDDERAFLNQRSAHDLVQLIRTMSRI
ncbi:hypothetical protein Q4E93_13050 [Flavitalea sp. BT771]|uniref:hypothetical protein n=1 Tax=Flavitalea sp. BT771 TaxID=3063329 RepID=UPI0026E36759|nr:hypothetical protein [Flavitalea sp. BT771]MDO6431525.1 hypothetical protein [Flavitalea sp. BT771]MDV6220433.1 hypothetical protein [Flavitalea sp. BT771]